jgi:hypothetical protein
MNSQKNRMFFILSGISAILWPVLMLGFYAAYPIAAGKPIRAVIGGQAEYAMRLAELGQRPAVIILEWLHAGLPLLTWPMFLGLYRLLQKRNHNNLILLACCFGLFGTALMVFNGTFYPAFSHNLGEAYLNSGSEAEGAALIDFLFVTMYWYQSLNVLASLLYQVCVGLFGAALIKNKTWRVRGWLGVVGAFLALIGKVIPGPAGFSNITWSGLAYVVWPFAVGVGLLMVRKTNDDLWFPPECSLLNSNRYMRCL